ncbi:T9SS type A sorting domain-containing protein [Paracrocinitomix mangrovi]|uniref:T9SS type A sorting domain-containing protein n=1 Tax=Paracrocinitomix mangrovi TaxID=2862509 RepID=UPI001C8D0607|nr:T9SS type A sorting domain-containing protein [Paracrocinitomix mangrovi]UKN02012.1 T9SS type A sorting domain-containing protein [Paracrocinitomix mangrovi]
MKNIILSLIGLISFNIGQAQWLSDTYIMDFEDTTHNHQLFIDTVSNPNNIWQIGPPQKAVLSTAYSVPNVIITDTVNYYPTNDTSSFIFTNTESGGGFEYQHTAVIAGFYKVQTDSLNDNGYLEFSPDNGTTWIDLINDTVYSSYYSWETLKPTFTGNSNGWQQFSVNVAGLGSVFNIQYGDTVLYKFTFISDNNPDTLGGLMFDDFSFIDYVEGIEELSASTISSTVIPNPADDLFVIKFENKEAQAFSLSIYDTSGKLVFKKDDCQEEMINLDADLLQSGLYSYVLSNRSRNKIARGKILIK